MTSSSWVDGAAGSLFDADNLPYGVFVRSASPGDPDEPPRVGVRIGSSVVDVAPKLGYALETQTRPIYAFVPDLTTVVH